MEFSLFFRTFAKEIKNNGNMSQKIAFRPHQTRGIDMINTLRNMGGKNKFQSIGWTVTPEAYFIDESGIIRKDLTRLLEKEGYKIYTLEEYEEEMKKSEPTVEPSMVKLDEVCEWIQKNMKKYVKYKTSRGEDGEIEFTIISHSVDMVRDLRKEMEK